MYPEILPNIRKAIKRRYELIPYLYSLALQSHLTAVPPQRSTGWGYETDAEIWTNKILKDGETQYWLGDSLLVGGVFESNAESAKVYLPRKDGHDPGYLNLNAPYEYFEAGQWVDVSSPWKTSIPVIARVGGAVPIGVDVQTLSPGEHHNPAALHADDFRAVEIFPPRGSSDSQTYSNTWYEDDGISREPAISSFTISYSCSDDVIEASLDIDTTSGFIPLWTKLVMILPIREKRSVSAMDGKPLGQLERDSQGRRRFEL